MTRYGTFCVALYGAFHCAALPCCGQHMDTGSIFSRPVQMDTFVVKSGFDVSAFIRRVRNDTTFYKSFRSMHLLPYTAVNDITVHGRSNVVAASEHSTTRQEVQNRCRHTRVIDRKTTGDMYDRRGNYNYYTAEMFAYLFFIKDTVCNEDDIVAGKMGAQDRTKMEKAKAELKQLMFNPGSKVSGVPFMSDRASIFDTDEAEQCDFKISLVDYAGQPAYQFRITPRKGYERKVVFNELTTWFRKGDYSILARDHSLSYHTLVYDFDVTMKVRTTQVNGKLYPSYISYNGNWHIFTKKRERVRFTVDITY